MASCCGSKQSQYVPLTPGPLSGSALGTPALTAASVSGETEAGTGERKRKRARPVLACTACKRRKIKCDRNLPCDSCMKRGEGDKCEWDPQVEPERTGYVTTEEFQTLQDRLDVLEAVLRERKSLDTCCPPSCACHEEPATRSGASPLNVGEDLPIAQLIDQKLGFSRDAGPSKLQDTTVERVDGLTSIVAGGVRATSTVWLDEAKQPPKQYQQRDNTARLPLLNYFGSEMALQLIDNALPPKQACDALLQAFFQDFAWSSHVLHVPSFQREYGSFWLWRSVRPLASVDPAWLALLLVVLALGVRCLSDGELPRDLQKYSHVELAQWPELFFECSQSALKTAQWTRRPQVRVLQTILLFLPYLDFTSEGPDTLVWIGAMVKIAHLLNLQHLAADDRLLSANDPAVPQDSAGIHLRQQIARRLWLCIQSANTMACIARQNATDFMPVSDGLQGLLNCDDIDLEGDTPPKAKDPEVITDISFEIVKYRLAVHQQQCLHARTVLEGPLSPPALHRLDSDLRVVLTEFSEPPRPPGGGPYSRKTTQLLRRYHMISSAVHYRLLRLHRPYMHRGYSDPDYQKSTRAVVDSALAILSANNCARSISTGCSWFFILHCIEAVVVIFVDIFWRMDHSADMECGERNKQDLTNAAFTFGAAAGSFSPQVQQLARLGKALLPKFLEEESSRRSCPVAHREPLSRIFERTALSLCAPEQSEIRTLASFSRSDGLSVESLQDKDTTEVLHGFSLPSSTDFQIMSDVFNDFDFGISADPTNLQAFASSY